MLKKMKNKIFFPKKEKKIPQTTKVEKNSRKVLIEVTNLKKVYGSTTIFEDVNFKIHEGEKVALIGINGVGKSTIVDIICGVQQQTDGQVMRNFKNHVDFMQNLGVQFQECTYPADLSVKSLIDFYAAIYNNQDIDIQELIKTLKIDELLKKRIKRISGGQKQRVNILLSILHNPKFLILDEVSTGLDLGARTEIKKLIKDLSEKYNWTMCLITHNVEELSYLCDRIILLGINQQGIGNVVEDDSIENIVKKYKSLDKFISTHFEY